MLKVIQSSQGFWLPSIRIWIADVKDLYMSGNREQIVRKCFTRARSAAPCQPPAHPIFHTVRSAMPNFTSPPALEPGSREAGPAREPGSREPGSPVSEPGSPAV